MNGSKRFLKILRRGHKLNILSCIENILKQRDWSSKSLKKSNQMQEVKFRFLSLRKAPLLNHHTWELMRILLLLMRVPMETWLSTRLINSSPNTWRPRQRVNHLSLWLFQYLTLMIPHLNSLQPSKHFSLPHQPPLRMLLTSWSTSKTSKNKSIWLNILMPDLFWPWTTIRLSNTSSMLTPRTTTTPTTASFPQLQPKTGSTPF